MSSLIPMVLLVISAGPDDPAGPAPGNLTAYQSAAKHAGKDPAAQVKLALWCESHGMSAERMKHLAAAVMADPSNALARGLMGLVNRGGKWERPEEVSRGVKDDPRLKALREEYFHRRARTPDRAGDQWRLALWCDGNGLKEEAIAHYHAVVRLDPRREAAWKHLGFKKVKGRWVKPEWIEVARREAELQKAANKRWKPVLEQLRSRLASPDDARREKAWEDLRRVTDPRAVPMAWAVFAERGGEGHRIAVELLGQLDAASASRALAILALRSPDAVARRQAIQILRRRDPRDFAPMLIALLRDTIEFEVRPVNGPGSSGDLLIKGKSFNIDRRYSPPLAPFVPLMLGDTVTVDGAGLPVIDRSSGFSQPIPGNNIASAEASIAQQMASLPHPRSFSNLGLSPKIAVFLNAAANPPIPVDISVSVSGKGRFVSRSFSATESISVNEYIPIGEMIREAQKAAVFAEAQLQNDVAFLRAWNGAVRRWNQGVLQVLSGATGVDLGPDRTAWQRWVVDLSGYAYTPPPSPTDTPTLVEQVPLIYQPQPIPASIQERVSGFQLTSTTVYHNACFGAGTPVRALDGLRRIETLRPGDLVLTEDPTSGELRYRAVVIAYHNPPNGTYRIRLGTGESIVVTGIHRLWKPAVGWIMARELKSGDVLRTLGGTAAIEAIERDSVQPVFNLKVAEAESYFVGEVSVLAHDNSPVEPVAEPFDAVGPLDVASAPAPVASPNPASPVRRRSMLGH